MYMYIYFWTKQPYQCQHRLTTNNKTFRFYLTYSVTRIVNFEQQPFDYIVTSIQFYSNVTEIYICYIIELSIIIDT